MTKTTEAKSFTASIVTGKSADQVYRDILDVRGWWQGEINGNTDKKGEEFTYRMGDVHFSRQKVAELMPGKKVVWEVTESRINFVEKKTEWTGTTIIFDIETLPEGNTKITFTHEGLVPEIECFEGCSGAWDALIRKSLFSLITTGKGVDVF